MNIITNYVMWLEGFIQKNPKYKQQASQYIEELKSLSTLIELKEKLTEIIRALGHETSLFTDNPLRDQFKRWNNELTDLHQSHTRAKKTIASVLDNELKDMDDVVGFIQTLVNEPNCLLHHCALSLFKHLEEKDEFTVVLSYLFSLKEAAASDNLRKNTFEAIEPENDAHQRCISLLTNNSAAYDPMNEHWQKANGILQTVLKIHQDIQNPDFSHAENYQGWCTII